MDRLKIAASLEDITGSIRAFAEHRHRSKFTASEKRTSSDARHAGRDLHIATRTGNEGDAILGAEQSIPRRIRWVGLLDRERHQFTVIGKAYVPMLVTLAGMSQE